MGIEGLQVLELGQDVLGQALAPRHPLEVVTASVVVRPVEARPGKESVKPSQEGLVAHVHLHHELWRPTVAAESSLADEQSGQHSALVFA